MKLQDYLLILLNEELSEVIKASSKVIRHGKNHIIANVDAITTEDILSNEIADCLANIFLLNCAGLTVVPNTTDIMLKDEAIFNEIEYRVNAIMRVTENTTNINLNKQEFEEFKKKAYDILNTKKYELKEKIDKKNYKAIIGEDM